jgi:adenylate cyclase
MIWAGQTTLNNSYERIRKTDTERRLVDRKIGRVEPDIENMKLGEAREFELAILHVDINDFKSIVRKINNDQYLRLVSIYLTEMTQIITDLNGMVEKYVGDQVTALFGINSEHMCNDCACNACIECALNMQTVISYSMNSYLESVGLPRLTCSIGMDFGSIWIAKVGVKGNNQFTLIGNYVNIASELVKSANDGKILLGEALYENISSDRRTFCHEVVFPDWQWKWKKNGYSQMYKAFSYDAYWKDFPL